MSGLVELLKWIYQDGDTYLSTLILILVTCTGVSWIVRSFRKEGSK